MDALWEAIEAMVEAGREVRADQAKPWSGERRVFTVGQDSTGIVRSTAGPKRAFVQVESNNNDKEVRFWVAMSSVTELPPASQDDVADSTGINNDNEGALARAQAEAENLMRKAFGKRLNRVEVYSHVDGGFNVLVFFDATEGWSVNSTRRGIEADMRDAYRQLYSSGVAAAGITLFAHATLSDKFGRESRGLVYKTSMDQ
ncbi:MAG: hypothetical protein M3505_06860, partial [Verrucomicrobiota bacterium]|nr:hypothetical protein [Verrucomicrobiota bacterium]